MAIPRREGWGVKRSPFKGPQRTHPQFHDFSQGMGSIVQCNNNAKKFK